MDVAPEVKKLRLEVLLNSLEVRSFDENGQIVIPKPLRKYLSDKDLYRFFLVNIKSQNEYNGVKGVLIYPVEVKPKID
ncbi:MAG: hypothetical protein AABY22_25445 [Nanoarchaeota archaeon]